MQQQQQQQYPEEGEENKQQWTVQQLENKGRGVVSLCVLPAGSVVLQESRPLVAVVHQSRSLECCATCLGLRHAEVSTRFLPQPLVCTQCNQAAWCSEECRNQSQVAGAHPAQLCFAYRKLGEMAAAAAAEKAKSPKASSDDSDEPESVLLDPEALSDARLLFYTYLFRRYRSEEFAKWSLLCSPPEDAAVLSSPKGKATGSSSSSSSSSTAASATASSGAQGAASAQSIAEEARIEALHDVVVACLQYAADTIAAPTPLTATPGVKSASPPEESPLAFPVLSLPPAPATATPAAGSAAATASPVALPAVLAPPPSLSLPRLSKQFTDLHISHPSDDLTSSLALDADLPVTRRFYLKNACNAFALSAPHDKLGNRQTPRGYALYTQAAMFNHSCMPNVTRFDKIDARDVKFTKKAAAATPTTPATPASASSSSSSFPASSSAAVSSPSSVSLAPSPSECSCSSMFTPLALELRTLHEVPAYTELTLSYTPLFWERRDRQEHLASYAFKCRCARCRLEKNLEREERAKAATAGAEDEEEEEDEHEHGDDEDDDEGEEDDEEEEEEPLSDDSDSEAAAAAAGADALTRGELNIYCAKYICPSKLCGGTMAPVKAGSPQAVVASPSAAPAALGGNMECNTCAKVRTPAQFHTQLQKEFGARKR